MIPIKHLSSFASGSRVICFPPVLDTDEDHFVLVENMENAFNDLVINHGFNACGTQYGFAGGFVSVRKGVLNLVLIQDKALYLRSCAATLLAKQMNLVNKSDRIALFDEMQYAPVPESTLLGEYEGPLP